MVHHAVIDVPNDFAMAEPAGLLRDAQISRINETDEFRRFMIEPCIRIRWICRCFPEFLVLGQDMRLFFGQTARGIPTVTVGAAEYDVLGFVHRLNTLMALQASNTLTIRF